MNKQTNKCICRTVPYYVLPYSVLNFTNLSISYHSNNYFSSGVITTFYAFEANVAVGIIVLLVACVWVENALSHLYIIIFASFRSNSVFLLLLRFNPFPYGIMSLMLLENKF